ncbi:hypothetical protein CPLU01_02357 [Colletotrichum plurivorum]|uniref:Uncharacterized protein n=1 Tax=Colletotrichum plurivorum TaxID=2175906 RepID=A0A8H6KX67_9PEZI|nr:hypothetical protein CPLU01_02357 [Colletotrichum plurivorum]
MLCYASGSPFVVSYRVVSLLPDPPPSPPWEKGRRAHGVFAGRNADGRGFGTDSASHYHASANSGRLYGDGIGGSTFASASGYRTCSGYGKK